MTPSRRVAARLGTALSLVSLHALPAQAPAPANACIEAVAYLPLDPSVVGRDGNGGPALGTYERVSPDGRFVLRSYSGSRFGEVSLVELPAEAPGPLLAHRTPFSNEAFPVQGTWRYLVDVDGSHFRLADVLRSEGKAKPLFQGGMRGFYAAAAEMVAPSIRAQADLVWIRSMSWPQGDRAGQGTGPLQVRTLAIRDQGGRVEVVSDSGPQFICAARGGADGGVFTLPMISVDGREFSAMPIHPQIGQPSMRVYGLAREPDSASHPCDLRMDLHATPGKAVFGFAGARPAMLTYTDNASVYFVDRRPQLQDQVFRIEDWRTQVLASAFPGFTRDGRIVFGASWKDCPAGGTCEDRAGYVVADPYQNPDYRQQLQRLGLPSDKACITRAEVQRERQRFAAQQGLSP